MKRVVTALLLIPTFLYLIVWAPYFAFLAAILLGYMSLTQLMKNFYCRRYGWQ